MRAPRFPLQLILRYRAIGEGEWRQAQTANVSASGALVDARDLLELNTALEFSLALREMDAGAARSEVFGRGRIVRQVAPPEHPCRGFALVIDEYDFFPLGQLAHA